MVYFKFWPLNLLQELETESFTSVRYSDLQVDFTVIIIQRQSHSKNNRKFSLKILRMPWFQNMSDKGIRKNEPMATITGKKWVTNTTKAFHNIVYLINNQSVTHMVNMIFKYLSPGYCNFSSNCYLLSYTHTTLDSKLNIWTAQR
jgi:hypothetical protein